MYTEYIDPNFKWVNFTLEEQAKVIVAPRSNNELDATKLKEEFPEMLPIKESLIKYVFEPNKKTKKFWYQPDNRNGVLKLEDIKFHFIQPQLNTPKLCRNLSFL